RRRSVAVAPEVLGERPAADDPAGLAVDVVRADAAVVLVRSCLPRDQAEVILLRVLGGLGVGEVAAIVRKRPGNVRVLQHRGLRERPEDRDLVGGPAVAERIAAAVVAARIGSSVPRSRRFASRVRVAVASLAAFGLALSGGLASAGALPAPAQRVASAVLNQV